MTHVCLVFVQCFYLTCRDKVKLIGVSIKDKVTRCVVVGAYPPSTPPTSNQTIGPNLDLKPAHPLKQKGSGQEIMPVTDPLAEFGGVKPKRLLKDEEVVEVGSKTR